MREGGGGCEVAEGQIYSPEVNSALEVGTSNFPSSFNFLFLSHLIETPGLIAPWYVMTPL